MKAVLRQLVPILLMPVLVTTVLPWWLLSAFGGAAPRWQESGSPAAAGGLGAALVCLGLGLFLWCVALFVLQGKGTIAPWDPTERLVRSGPYGLVRNPMISAVALILLGEALFMGSPVLGLWFLLFLAINHAYFLLSEEPGLEKRFGDAYREYKKAVPRWVPRLRK